MRSRLSLQACAIVVLVCAVVALCFARPTVGQAPAAATGRYQMVVGPNDTNDAIYVLDVQTGECWFRQHLGNTKWASLGSPVIKRTE